MCQGLRERKNERERETERERERALSPNNCISAKRFISVDVSEEREILFPP